MLFCRFKYCLIIQIIQIAEVYSEPSRTSTMELFEKMVNGFELLNIFTKSSILDIPTGL